MAITIENIQINPTVSKRNEYFMIYTFKILITNFQSPHHIL